MSGDGRWSPTMSWSTSLAWEISSKVSTNWLPRP